MVYTKNFNIDNSGNTLATKELQKLIDSNDELYINKGTYLVGPLFLHDNFKLHLEEGAILCATIDENEYKDIFTRVAGIEMNWYPAIINAINANNILIDGKGTIFGNGPYWYNKYWGNDTKGGMREIYDREGIRFLCDYDCKRPRNLLISNCYNVTIKDITSKDSGFWNIHILYSHDVLIDGIIIDSGLLNSPSTDGIDIDSSHDIKIVNIIGETNDDSIAIKSGRDFDGIRVGIPCYNIEIADCLIKKGFGITLGSELSAGIYNVNIHDIKFDNTDCAFRIKSSNMRKGYVKNISFKKIVCNNVKYLFHVNLNWNPGYNKCRIPDSYRGEIKEYYHTLLKTDNSLPNTVIDDIHISNVKADYSPNYEGISRVFHLEGLDDSHIRNIYMNDMDINAIEYGFIKNTDNLDIKNSRINTKVQCIAANNDYDSR
ncbi:MAG: hypothetical protein K6A63_07095 [Acholeplasmatales bacterium]|nr:hypothetical protein [Acholeplasmatales bacterium]